MREIKFRGKSPEEEWVYGSYISRGHHNYLYDLIIDYKSRKKAVIPETVGQYTGLKDKNGKEIYEGDIVSAGFSTPMGDKPVIGEIFYSDDDLGYMLKTKENIYFFSRLQANVKIIGNKYENGDLL